jgi:capsular polysaccharide biosynthesis protein
MRLFARLYPASWRNRYEAEFNALLENVDPSWRTSLDILKGAVAMQLRTFSFRKLIAAACLSGLLVALGLWIATPKRFSSEAIIDISSPSADEKVVSQYVNRFVMNQLSRSVLKEFIEKRKLYPRERAKRPLEEVVEEMRRNIFATHHRDYPSKIFIIFSYEDPITAQRVTGDLVSKFMEYGMENYLRAGQIDYRSFTLELSDAPTLPTVPSSPKPLPIIVAGLAAGLVVGLSLALFRHSPKPA